MSDSEKISVAALISVILRRQAGRTIDVQWLVKNKDYAREIINVSREQDLPDLNAYADKLELLTFGRNLETQALAESNIDNSTPMFTPGDDQDAKLDVNKYIGHLR
jgi:hypothetical protein